MVFIMKDGIKGEVKTYRSINMHQITKTKDLDKRQIL